MIKVFSLIFFEFYQVFLKRKAVKVIVRRDILSEFIQTRLGPLWFIVHPTLQSTVFTLIFGKIGKMPTDGQSSFFFYMFGILVWQGIQKTSIRCSYTLIDSRGIVSKIPTPSLLFPVSQALMRSMENFCVISVFFLVYVFTVGYDVSTFNIFTIPALLIGILMSQLFALSGGLLVASISIRRRDFIHLWSYIVSALMFLSPIIYPVSALPEKWKVVASFNPLMTSIEFVRSSILGTDYPPFYFIFIGGSVLFLLFCTSVYIYSKRFKDALEAI